MKIYIKNIILLMLLSIMAFAAEAAEATPEQIKQIFKADPNMMVADPEGFLSEQTKHNVNQRLVSLRRQTSAEVAVTVVGSTGDIPIEEWAEQAFTSSKIGKKDKDNGVLLVIAVDDRKARIQTGYGVEGILTDAACSQIIRSRIVPAMRDDDVDEAVNGATMLISEAMTDPAVADELKSEQGENGINAISKEVLFEFIGIVAGSVFLVALALFCYDLVFTTRRRPDYYDKAELWRERRKTYLILGIVSLGTGLIFWLLASWIYNIWRTKRRKCPTCGHKMQRLPEDKDNELLNPSQDFEEQLNTVDYDVWECPHCGTIERFPFITKQTKYTECPACHTIAMCLKCDTVLQQPTTRRAGAGVRLYECQFCHHQHREGYTIPKKEDMSGAAAILGASILSGGSGGSGGGGGFGGFGGGATGGGGASGSW